MCHCVWESVSLSKWSPTSWYEEKSEGAYWLANSIDPSAFWEGLGVNLRFWVLWGAALNLRLSEIHLIQKYRSELYKSGGALPPFLKNKPPPGSYPPVLMSLSSHHKNYQSWSSGCNVKNRGYKCGLYSYLSSSQGSPIPLTSFPAGPILSFLLYQSHIDQIVEV